MRRIVVLGTGTEVGKTWVSVALVRELRERARQVIASKPVESGIDGASLTDAARLAAAADLPSSAGVPLYAFVPPISPHAAARAAGKTIALPTIRTWLEDRENTLHHDTLPNAARLSVIETAGGTFTPLAPGLTNFDLALALGPSLWVLVAPDALGVLSEVTATLLACRSRGREPDFLVLSAARTPDASTGTNGRELRSLGIADPIAELAAGSCSAISPLVDALLATNSFPC